MKNLILSILMFTAIVACTFNEPVATEAKKNVNREAEVELTIQNHLDTSFFGKGEVSILQKGSVIQNKPKEIVKLDSMIKISNHLPLERAKYGERLESVMAEQDAKIAAYKNELKAKNIYPWYEQNIIYQVSYGKDSNLISEALFEVYPNYKMKDVNTKFSINLSDKKALTFNNFVKQEPIFTSSSDPYQDYKKNKLFYNQLITALENEKEYKNELVHTVIRLVDFVKASQSFDESQFCKSEAKYWLSNNLKIDLKNAAYGKLTPENVIVNNTEVLNSYFLESIIPEENGKVRTFNFIFDLNFVLINVKENFSNE